MNESAIKPSRILVVARPGLGRSVADALTAAGHQVHRSPRPADVDALVRALVLDAALVSLDLPWADPLELAAELRAQPHPVPVLLIGSGDEDGLPRIEPNADPDRLRARVGELLSAPPGPVSREHQPLIAQTRASAGSRTPWLS